MLLSMKRFPNYLVNYDTERDIDHQEWLNAVHERDQRVFTDDGTHAYIRYRHDIRAVLEVVVQGNYKRQRY